MRTSVAADERAGGADTSNLKDAIIRCGADAQAKLADPGATGEPEDQLRARLETLFADLAALCGIKQKLVAVGESSLARLKTRPDYAITLGNLLVGFVEVKAPGKGADPRRYKGHDKEQWEKLQSLPNLLYTDGNSFSFWRDGELVDSILELTDGIETAGAKLRRRPGYAAFWPQPCAPSTSCTRRPFRIESPPTVPDLDEGAHGSLGIRAGFQLLSEDRNRCSRRSRRRR